MYELALRKIESREEKIIYLSFNIITLYMDVIIYSVKPRTHSGAAHRLCFLAKFYVKLMLVLHDASNVDSNVGPNV